MLAQTLDSIARLEIPDRIELTLIVIDNQSTDQTRQVLHSFAQSDFAQQHQFVAEIECRQGHTFSRNCAINQSQGDLILWTDDDVLVAEDWLSRYVHAASNQPDISFWGSVIEPCFPEGRPPWIKRNWDVLKGCFAARDLGEEAVSFAADRLPYGANFAIRGDVQRQHPFRTDLGRRGDDVLGEDELDLMRRLLDAGHLGVWIPGAVVQHVIPTSRANTEYVFNYFVGQGRALAVNQNGWSRDLFALRKEADREYQLFRWKRWFSSPTTWCSHLVRAGLARGQALQLEEG